MAEVEHSDIFKNEKGTEIKLIMKTECATVEEMRETLNFIAQCSQRFYLDVAEKINSKL